MKISTLLPEFVTNFFIEGHQRSIQAKKNIILSLAIKGLNIITGIVLVPLTINYINPTRYGIWLTISSMIGWLGFFDIGFGNGLRNKFAEAIANDDHDLARIYVSTTYAVLIMLVSFLLIAFFSINPFLDWTKILNTPPDMARELSLLAIIVIVFFFIQFVIQLITTVITANQQPAKASFFDLAGKLISLLIIFILTKTTTGSLLKLGLTLSVSPVIVLILASLWFYSNEYKKYAPSIHYVKLPYAKNLLSVGIVFFIIQIAVLIRFQTDNIIISQMFGPAEVTPFSIAYKYFDMASMSFFIIITPFWSAFTEAWVKKDIDWIKGTIKKLQLIWLTFACGIIFMLLISKFVYRIWVGDLVVIPFSVTIAMAIQIIVLSYANIFNFFINGVGKLRLQFYFYIITGILNIPISIFLARIFGILGIVLSLIFLSLLGAIWMPIQYNKIVNFKAKGIWNK